MGVRVAAGEDVAGDRGAVTKVRLAWAPHLLKIVVAKIRATRRRRRRTWLERCGTWWTVG